LVFEGDCPEELVNCFANVHQITENKRLKLLDIVRQQLAKVLEKIAEVEEEL